MRDTPRGAWSVVHGGALRGSKILSVVDLVVTNIL